MVEEESEIDFTLDSAFKRLFKCPEFKFYQIAVLADILELGDYAKEIHLKMGKVFKELKYDVLIAYGENMKYLIENAKNYIKEVYYCKDSTEAEKKVREIMRENDVIYFKGSNSMFVNKIVDDLKKDFVN